MKLKKLCLNELADAELNEREMCRILGGGTPGCCQCGCNYATTGGSSTSSNDSANNAKGFTSDPQPVTVAPVEPVGPPIIIPTHPAQCPGSCIVQESTCPKRY